MKGTASGSGSKKLIKRFYLFRSNIEELEYYHQYKNLDVFERCCHDFYMLFPIELLRKTDIDEVIIFRLSKNNLDSYEFIISGKKYIQCWVENFNEIIKLFPSPEISFWRGGFREYDMATKLNPNYFGNKLYLGASKRTIPIYGGIYDKFLVEDDNSLDVTNSIPFYKTANPNIFKSLNLSIEYDLCWICNFSQIRMKGQEWFIKKISEFKEMKTLKIAHIGNDDYVGRKLCYQYGVDNIDFLGYCGRSSITEILNKSKFGIVTSSVDDGCPRVITEILKSGCPLLIRNQTKLLSYYKRFGVIEFGDDFNVITNALSRHRSYKDELLDNLDYLSIKNIAALNFKLWGF